MKKLDIDSKGKQRQRSDENDDNDDMLIDVSLKAFIAEQVDTLQSPLIVPTQEELGCGDAEYRRVVKAVRHIQKRRLDKATIQAVIEQIEYLRTSERGKAKIVRLDEKLKIFVDKDDWLDDLPPEWPITTEMQAGEEVDIEDQKLDEYKRLYEATQSLRQKKHTLQQKRDHYKMTEEILARNLN